MNKTIITIALSIACGAAYASASDQGCTSSGGQASGCGTTVNTHGGNANNAITNANTVQVTPIQVGGSQSQSATGGSATQSQTAQGGNGGNGVGSASSRATASNQGVSTNVTVTNSTPDSIRTVGIAPDMITTTTASCRIAVGVSGGVLGGALGISSSVLDEGCDTREDARLLVNMGYAWAAVNRLCAKPEMAAALGPICPVKNPAAAVEPEYKPGS